jgi:DNA-binding response OmpR family regulator
MHVLLIENADLNQADSLAPSLQSQGYEVHLSHTPQTALEITQTLWPNFVVFNALHSSHNLASFQEAIDQVHLNLPYLIVADKNLVTNSIKTETILVASGKPQQLLQGLKKISTQQKNRFLRLPGLILDGEKHQLWRDGQVFSLTPKEFKLLHLFASNHNQIVTRKAIMREIWETEYMGDTRTLDVHIRWLREKIEEDPSHPHRLITIRGVGYRFLLTPE